MNKNKNKNNLQKKKIMKRLLFTVIAIISFTAVFAIIDNDKIISKEQLPAAAQTFISDYFSGLEISYVKSERELSGRNYEVTFVNGDKLEFDGNGNWVEVDCRYSTVPAQLIPERISKYVSAHYPNAKILKYDRDDRRHEVKLSNRMELTFNRRMELCDIDD